LASIKTTNESLTAVYLLETLSDGLRLAAFLSSGFIQFWNMSSFQLDNQLKSHSLITAMRLLPNGNLLCLDNLNRLFAYNTVNYSLLTIFLKASINNPIRSLHVLNDGALVTVFTQSSGGSLSLWNSTSGAMLGAPETFSQAIFSSIKLTDDLIAVAGSSGFLEIIQIASNHSMILARSGPLATDLSVTISMLAYNGQYLALEFGYQAGHVSFIGKNLAKTDAGQVNSPISLIEFHRELS
jgi:WD40 repeat protein